jgi:hypothetical protein
VSSVNGNPEFLLVESELPWRKGFNLESGANLGSRRAWLSQEQKNHQRMSHLFARMEEVAGNRPQGKSAMVKVSHAPLP